MKKLLLLSVLTFPLLASGQDVITMHNGQEFQVKIVKETDTDLSYHGWEGDPGTTN